MATSSRRMRPSMDQWPTDGRAHHSKPRDQVLGCGADVLLVLKSSSAVFLSTKRMRVKQLRMACMLSPSSQSALSTSAGAWPSSRAPTARPRPRVRVPWPFPASRADERPHARRRRPRFSSWCLSHSISSASGASKIVSFLCTLSHPPPRPEGAGRGCRAGIAPCCRGQRRAEGSLAIRAPC